MAEDSGWLGGPLRPEEGGDAVVQRDERQRRQLPAISVSRIAVM